jgi:predicted DNA-binding antitoxin AbrB/MazE fold protein
MSLEFHAIYDSGLFRPLDPLDLPDGARVLLRVEEESIPATVAQNPTAEVLAGQQAALRELDEIMAKLPVEHQTDGLTGRDHDKILYGQP